MKTLLLSTALAAGFALPAVAQDTPMMPFQTEAAGPAVSASDMIGARIYASETTVDAQSYAGVQDGWSDIGEVNDIILGRDGTVDAVLVDIGGFLGIGERQVAVDMGALRFVQDDATDADDWFLVLEADRATLEGAPAWTLARDGAALDTGMGTDTAVTGPAITDPVVGDTAATDPATAAPGTMAAPQAAETLTEAPATEGRMVLPEGYAAIDRTGLTTEMLTGANVYDATDTSIAKVSDLVLTAEGQVTHVVVDVGGFLGIGARSVALPLDRVTVAQNNASVRLWVDLTREELEALPEHTM